jgi:hypothetical protein
VRLFVGERGESAARFLLGSLTRDLHAVWSDLAALASVTAVLMTESSAVDMAAILERC